MLEKIIPIILGGVFGFLISDAYHESKNKKAEEQPLGLENNLAAAAPSPTPIDESKMKSEIKEEVKGELKTELRDELGNAKKEDENNNK